MKILFLGTGAADYNEKHRDMIGYRRNSSALVDGCILIDPGPCVPDALKSFGVDVAGIKYILNTHPHKDHYNEETVKFLQNAGAELITLSGGETKTLGKHTVTALAGNHSVPVRHFIIEDGKSKLFYGLDSAWLLYDEVQAMKASGIDFAVLDGTVGFIVGDYRVFEHCNMDMIVTMKASLERYVKRFCISHMARTLHTDHDTLASEMAKHGIEVAFDGWTAEF